MALHIVKCSGVFSRALSRMRFLSRDESRARRQRVFGLSARLTTRPPRCFVRVVSLGGSCFVWRRARSGSQPLDGRARLRVVGVDRGREGKIRSRATTWLWPEVRRLGSSEWRINPGYV
jgi:hypothetical protein